MLEFSAEDNRECEDQGTMELKAPSEKATTPQRPIFPSLQILEEKVET